MARKSSAKPNSGAWRRPAAAQSCCASPWRQPIGCIAWLIPQLCWNFDRPAGPFRIADSCELAQLLWQKERPPRGGLLQMFQEGGDQIANARPFEFRRNAA